MVELGKDFYRDPSLLWTAHAAPSWFRFGPGFSPQPLKGGSSEHQHHDRVERLVNLHQHGQPRVLARLRHLLALPRPAALRPTGTQHQPSSRVMLRLTEPLKNAFINEVVCAHEHNNIIRRQSVDVGV